MSLNYQNYTFRSVYGQVDEALRTEIVAFWTRSHAITDIQEAWRRTREVVLVVRNPAGEIAGISSVVVCRLPENKRYYFYRMFIQPRDRIYGMMHAVTVATREFLR